MAVVQVNFGRNALDLVRADIRDAIETATRSVMMGSYTEADYKFNAGIAYGLQQALNAIDAAEKEMAKEK